MSQTAFPPVPPLEAPAQPAPRVIYVCSDWSLQGDHVLELTRATCQAILRVGDVPLSPVLLYPGVLNYHDPAEREKGLLAALALLRRVDEVWYLDHGSVHGMRRELDEARRLGLRCRPVRARRIQGAEEAWWVRHVDNLRCGICGQEVHPRFTAVATLVDGPTRICLPCRNAFLGRGAQ